MLLRFYRQEASARTTGPLIHGTLMEEGGWLEWGTQREEGEPQRVIPRPGNFSRDGWHFPGTILKSLWSRESFVPSLSPFWNRDVYICYPACSTTEGGVARGGGADNLSLEFIDFFLVYRLMKSLIFTWICSRWQLSTLRTDSLMGCISWGPWKQVNAFFLWEEHRSLRARGWTVTGRL